MKKTKLIIIAVIVLLLASAAGYFFYKQDSTISKAELKTAVENLKKVDAKTVTQADNYPKTLGKYSENGLTIVEKYECYDVCPDNAILYLIYDGIKSQAECDKIGGVSLTDPVWGVYTNCAPSVE